MKTLGILLLFVGVLGFVPTARAQPAHIQAVLLAPARPNPTVTQSNPLIEMGITVQPAAGVALSTYQVQILLTTSNPATDPNAPVAASAEYTPAEDYTEAEIDTTALPAGVYWVSVDLL